MRNYILMEDIEESIFPVRTTFYAKFWPRFAAAFLDGLILWIPSKLLELAVGGSAFLVSYIKGELKDMPADDFHKLLTRFLIFQMSSMLLSLFYFSIMEASKGQSTFGKRALGLRVTDLNGGRITIGRAIARNAGKYVSTLTLFIGYLMNAWDNKGQTLHDKMAGCLVVKKANNTAE